MAKRQVFGCVPFKNKHDRKRIQAKLLEEYGKVKFYYENKILSYECYVKAE